MLNCRSNFDLKKELILNMHHFTLVHFCRLFPEHLFLVACGLEYWPDCSIRQLVLYLYWILYLSL